MKNPFKELNLDDCALKNTRIDLWQYSLEHEFSETEFLLNPDEHHRANRYHFDIHRRRFTIARAIMRLILARYSLIAADKLVFKENKYGKPQLVNCSNLQFNLSHSQDLALLAVGCHYPLGVDLEFFSTRSYQGIAKQMFSTDEQSSLENTLPELEELAFFNIWAQKEAFIKACGLGLSYPTQEFSVEALPTSEQLIIDSLNQHWWKMISFQPTERCSAALCFEPSIDEIRYLALNNPTKIRL